MHIVARNMASRSELSHDELEMNENNVYDDIRCRKKHWVPRARKVILNICGAKYVVLESTLQRYPDTLLASKEKMKRFWDEENDEYFLDRNRTCFETILTYYQSHGILSRPLGIPDALFEAEVTFYELGEGAMKSIQKKQKKMLPKRTLQLPKNKQQRQLWRLFEYPESSKAASCIAWVSFTVIIISVVVFCIETLPTFHNSKQSHRIFFIIEAVCISWFTIEYLIRLLSSPNKWIFFKGPLNLVDLIAIIPFFLALAIGNNSNVPTLAILRAVRLVRVLRVFKLSRYSTGLQILGKTIHESLSEIGLLLFFLCLGVILFGSAAYYAEMNVVNGPFESIPHSFWWALVTMTTVGYGDMYPVTPVGKIIGSLCACSGIMAIALPVPVIVANFERFYSKAIERMKQSHGRHKKYEKYKALRKFLGRVSSRRRRISRRGAPSDITDIGVTEEVTSTSMRYLNDILVERNIAEQTV